MGGQARETPSTAGDALLRTEHVLNGGHSVVDSVSAIKLREPTLNGRKRTFIVMKMAQLLVGILEVWLS